MVGHLIRKSSRESRDIGPDETPYLASMIVKTKIASYNFRMWEGWQLLRHQWSVIEFYHRFDVCGSFWSSAEPISTISNVPWESLPPTCFPNIIREPPAMIYIIRSVYCFVGIGLISTFRLSSRILMRLGVLEQPDSLHGQNRARTDTPLFPGGQIIRYQRPQV